MTDNIEKVVQRGEALEDISDRTQDLALNSSQFRKSATKLRRRACWQKYRLYCCCATVILIIILVVVIAAFAALLATKKIKT